MPAKLTVCYTDKPAVERQLIEQHNYRIGRSLECELILNHPTVSRTHASVEHCDSNWRLADKSSQNGVKVNGVKIQQSFLNGDELITVGEVDCLFEMNSIEQLDAINKHNQWRLKASKESVELDGCSLQQMLQNQLASLVSITGTQRGVVLLGNNKENLKVSSSLCMSADDFKDNTFEGSVGAILQALDKQQPVIAMDVSTDRLLKNRKSIQLKKIASLAALPLKVNNQLVGIVYTDSQQSNKVLTELDMDIMYNMCAQIELNIQALTISQQVAQLQKLVIPNNSLSSTDDTQILNQPFIKLVH